MPIWNYKAAFILSWMWLWCFYYGNFAITHICICQGTFSNDTVFLLM